MGAAEGCSGEEDASSAWRREGMALLRKHRLIPALDAPLGRRLALRQRAPDWRRVSADKPPPAIFMDKRKAFVSGDSGRRLEICDYDDPNTMKRLQGKAATAAAICDAPRDSPAGSHYATLEVSREELEYRSEDGPQGAVPLLIIAPKREVGASIERRPALVLLHDAGRCKDDLQARMEDLASQRGYVTAAIDARYHGGRAASPRSWHQALRAACRRDASPPCFLLDTLLDVMNLIDYLAARPDVDSMRVGIVGLGTGGTLAVLAAAMDDAGRIAAVAAAPRLLSMRWTLDEGQWRPFLASLSAASLGYGQAEARDATTTAGALAAAFDALEAERTSAPGDASLAEILLRRVAPGLLDHFDARQAACHVAKSTRMCLLFAEDDDGLRLAAQARRIWASGDVPDASVQIRALPMPHAHAFDAAVDGFLAEHLGGLSRPAGAKGTLAVAAEQATEAPKYGSFLLCPLFMGERDGYEYITDGPKGTGYYFRG